MAPHDLILLGQGPSMNDCPFDVETWAAVSVLSHKGFEDKPYSKVFCFDNPEGKRDEKEGLEVAIARNLTIVGWTNIPSVAEIYPLKKIREEFDNTYYFKNDMSYMLAYAMYLGYKSLLLWGVDEGPDAAHEQNRPFVTFWLGVATGMGVEWELAPKSVLWRKHNEDRTAS